MKIYISQLAYKETINSIISHFPNSEILYTKPSKKVSTPISTHPDIFMCRMGIGDDSKVFLGDQKLLGKTYPEDCIYNASVTDDFFIHNIRHTNRELKECAIKYNKQLIDVNQGYCRCSALPLGINGIITADEGIFKKCLSSGFVDFKKIIEAENTKYSHITDKNKPIILLISKGNILLPQHKYGFIGGCGGQIEDIVFFNGDISSHPDFQYIKMFLDLYDLKLVYSHKPLLDIGSILYEKS